MKNEAIKNEIAAIAKQLTKKSLSAWTRGYNLARLTAIATDTDWDREVRELAAQAAG